MTRLTKYEQETIIVYNNGEKTARVYTCDNAKKRTLEDMERLFPKEFVMISEDEYSVTYIIPKKYARITKKRVITDKIKAELKNRGYMLGKNRKGLAGNVK